MTNIRDICETTGPVKSSLKRDVLGSPPEKHVRLKELTPPESLHLHDDDDYDDRMSSPELQSLLDEEQRKPLETDNKPIPQHHQVLYNLLGAEKAESILNPKMEAKPKQDEAVGTKVRSRLPSVVNTGLGAEALWKFLKHESDEKLEKMDNKIPIEWKVSYGAFIRDSISRSRPIVQRSFTNHADVKELSKLIDKRYEERVRKARHHANVMFRASENNKNKTTLLLSNNPVPDNNDREGVQSLARYFSDMGVETSGEAEDSTALRRLQLRSTAASEADLLGRAARRRFDNLRFLTERGARTAGTFYGKYANTDEIKMVTDFPGFRTKLPDSMTARMSVTAPIHSPLPSAMSPLRAARRQPEPLFVTRTAPPRYKRDPAWQPLTVGALMEYAPIRSAAGFGDFRYGSSQRWRTPAPPGTA